MPTVYTNSLSYLQVRNTVEAERLGYINSILYGASAMSMIPIVPANDFMQDIFFERKAATTRRSGVRLLNEETDANHFNPFEKNSELTSIYTTNPTSIDKKLAEFKPEVFDTMMRVDLEDLMMNIDYDIFNGTTSLDGRGIAGLKQRIPTTSPYYIDNSADLIINTSATTFKAFLRLFRKGVMMLKRPPGSRVTAFVSESVYLAVQSGRDELGANVVGVGTTDILNQQVTTIDGIPLVIVRQDAASQETLPFDEAGSTGSLFLVVHGGGAAEGSYKMPNGVVILSSDQVIQTYDNTTLTQIQATQEMDIGLRVPKRSVVRIGRLKVA